MEQNQNRRKFLQETGHMALGATLLPYFPGDMFSNQPTSTSMDKLDTTPNMIGPYGPWAAGLVKDPPGPLSFRNKDFSDIASWREQARERVSFYLSRPDLGPSPTPEVHKTYTYDGLHIEELSWQLPYGRPTEAILLKPANSTGPLPGILGLHDHGGNKYFGKRKITRTSEAMHPLMQEHQALYYEGKAWANELAKQGYAVLIPDAFPFASRRVQLEDVPERIRGEYSEAKEDDPASIESYNQWAGNHEHIMAKSLFCAGTSWPGVFLAEDQIALDILCNRPDVDSTHVGCAGLSGGGMRTAFLGGMDSRIQCAVCVGFMTTWRDFLLYKCYTHTWMVYVPLLPKEMDFPEILALRAPLPTLVLNDEEDQLFTLEEMKRADEIMASVYEKAGSRETYKASFYPGPHKFDQAMQAEAFAWFNQFLQ